VLGPNAANIVFGDYSGKPVIKPVSVLDGIKAKVGDQIEITHVRWKSTLKEFVLIESDFLSNDTSDEKGLYAEYFDNMNLKGAPKTRIDKMVNYDAASQPPDPVISDAPMSIRWTGYITPRVSGAYKIAITSSDGIRFWVEDKLVINKWHGRGETTDQIEYKMSAGQKYAVKLEYFVNRDDEICQLFWQLPGSSNSELFTADKKAAKESDCIVAVMGINKNTEREGLDRKTIDLPAGQVKYLKEIYKENQKIVVVLIAGSAMAVNWMDENIPAIVEAWYPGESGGAAIADVIFGDYNPGGRLPFTFYKSIDDLPAFDDYDIYNGRTYMYFEGEPLYPFGYGKSYTTFSYANLVTDKDEYAVDEKIIISTDITNTGPVDGDEVVQLYVTDLESSVKRPLRELKGFKRIHLKKDETKTVTFIVPASELKFWDSAANSWKVEPGKFEIMIGQICKGN